MIEDLAIGDWVIFRSDGYLYKGIIKGFQGSKVEIDDGSIKIIDEDHNVCPVNSSGLVCFKCGIYSCCVGCKIKKGG